MAWTRPRRGALLLALLLALARAVATSSSTSVRRRGLRVAGVGLGRAREREDREGREGGARGVGAGAAVCNRHQSLAHASTSLHRAAETHSKALRPPRARMAASTGWRRFAERPAGGPSRPGRRTKPRLGAPDGGALKAARAARAPHLKRAVQRKCVRAR